MSWQAEGPGWTMRVLISLGVFVLVFLVGVRTEWLSVSKADLATVEDQARASGAYQSRATDGRATDGRATDDRATDSRANEDRAFEAVVLGLTRPDATSGELIDAAVTRGEINSEQALLYGVYLACADPRLPAQFRGQDMEPPARNILWQADIEWQSLSPDIRQALHAFFTQGPVAQAGLTCGDQLARLKGDATVWWAPALQEQ